MHQPTACDVTDVINVPVPGVKDDALSHLGCIASGSFGCVHRAYCHQLKLECAVKRALSGGKLRNERLNVEIRLLKLLRHPRVVSYMRAKLHATDSYLVMEYAAGGCLNDRIVSGAGCGGEDGCRHVWRQVVQALVYLHRHRMGIVHRDVKPENVLLMDAAARPAAKLCDFGLSCRRAHARRMSDTNGTCEFAAPRILLNKLRHQAEPFTSSVDVWSVGVSVHKCALDGRHPFAFVAGAGGVGCGDLDGLVRSIEAPAAEEEVDRRLSGLSAELRDFIAVCLTRDGSVRPNVEALQSHKWLEGSS